MTIRESLNEHWSTCVKGADRPVLYLSLFGSQNYGLDTPNSDVDTKAIILPKVKEVILGKSKFDQDFILENGEICKTKDCRLMFNEFLRGNINYIEMLYSDWYVAHPYFEEEIDRLRTQRDFIASNNPLSVIRTTGALAKQKARSIEEPSMFAREMFAQYGYNPKELHHLCRYREFLKSYCADLNFEVALRPVGEVKDFLIDLKVNPPSLDKAKQIKNEALESVCELVKVADKMVSNKAEIEEYLNQLWVEIFYRMI